MSRDLEEWRRDGRFRQFRYEGRRWGRRLPNRSTEIFIQRVQAVGLEVSKDSAKLLLYAVNDRNRVAPISREIISLEHTIYFELLQLRLIANVHQRVQRGELTERGLARGIGISQPHLHNMLKGVRVLSPPMADLLLRHLHMSVLDLLDSDELAARHPDDRAW